MNAAPTRRKTIAPPSRKKQAAQKQAAQTRRKRAVEGETKRDRFLRIGQFRVVNALSAIRLVGNLADTNTYDWRPEDAVHIVTSLQEAIDAVSTRFTREKRPVRPETAFKIDLPSSASGGVKADQG